MNQNRRSRISNNEYPGTHTANEILMADSIKKYKSSTNEDKHILFYCCTGIDGRL